MMVLLLGIVKAMVMAMTSEMAIKAKMMAAAIFHSSGMRPRSVSAAKMPNIPSVVSSVAGEKGEVSVYMWLEAI